VARADHAGAAGSAMFTSQNRTRRASFQPYAPKTASLQDLQAMVRYHTTITIPSAAVLKQELKAYAGRPEERFGFQAEYRYDEICGADLCRVLRRLSGRAPQFGGGGRGIRRSAAVAPASFLANGTAVFASVAWVRLWPVVPVVGGIWVTGRERMNSPIAAFVVAGGIFVATLSAGWLGRFGTALQQAHTMAAGARACS